MIRELNVFEVDDYINSCFFFFLNWVNVFYGCVFDVESVEFIVWDNVRDVWYDV